MRWLTPDRKSGFITRSISIQADLFPMVLGALDDLTQVKSWESFGERSPEESAYFCEEAIANMGGGFVGLVFPTIGAIPDGCLPCDGSYYFAEEYPQLYQVIDSSLKDAAGFRVPDLDSRFLMGGGSIGLMGGESSHTLTILEMPIHNHGEHTHLPGEGTGEIPTPIPDMPIPDVMADRGGGMPHNNLPPYFTVKYCVVAK